MRKFLVFLAFLPLLAAANTEPLPSRLKVLKHSSWYQDKAVYWKRQIDRNPDMADAWFNYYFSLTYANAPAETRKKVAETALSKWPELYETKLIAAKDLGYSDEGMAYYNDIRLLRPDDPEVLSIGLLHAEINADMTEKRRIAQRLFDLNLISPSLYNYAYNLLMSVGEDAVLFSEGEHTSIPLVVLQEVMDVRPDVKIVNINLLEEAGYRVDVLRLLGLDQKYKTLSRADMLARLPESSVNRPLYFSMTVRKHLLEAFSTRLNLTGLALKYVPDNLNTTRELAENFSRFLTDYLVADFNNEGESAAGRVLEPNYLPGLIILKAYFDQTNQSMMMKRTDRLISRVSEYAGLTSQVRNILTPGDEASVVYKPVRISVREIDNAMKVIKKPLYASNIEVTNESYYQFLSYLRDNGYEKQYNIARIDLRKFDEVALSSMKSYFRIGDAKKKGAETFTDYPVINISYEAAVLYCDWLTQQYNQQDKRGYRKVKFRLPTLQ
ncbi:MAG: SUMF1/EgtB/PvdO family nonheme iron enzyme, partial [Cyclobacteriaceae bacterium]